MKRRSFIRVVGGGVIVAATIGGVVYSGCTQSMPAGAIAAWKGPGPQDDIRRWLVGYAILAPHSHNLQSWLVDLRIPNEIGLSCDLTRVLPQADPYGRQIMMSHGTFLELLDIAARECGLRADITLFPEGAFSRTKLDQRPIAQIRLSVDSSVSKDPLFAQIVFRRTNRAAYDALRSVPVDVLQAMTESVQAYPVQFGFIGRDQPETLRLHREIANEAWAIELTTPRVIMETYNVLRVGAAEIDQHRDGLYVLDRIPILMNQVGLFDRSKPPAPNDYATTSQIASFVSNINTTPNFLWLTSASNDRVTQVNAGRAYMRLQLAATAAGISLQPLSQALQEYPEQASTYAKIHRLLDAAQTHRTVQMWVRAGYAPQIGPAPRRGVEAQLLSASA